MVGQPYMTPIFEFCPECRSYSRNVHLRSIDSRCAGFIYLSPMWNKDMSFQETAALIGRLLNHESLYPQEWNDFVETSQSSKKVDQFRRRCYELVDRKSTRLNFSHLVI